MSLVPVVVCSLTVLVLCGRSRAATTPCKLVKDEPCKCMFNDAGGSTAMIDISSYLTYPFAPTSDNDTKYTYKYDCKDFLCNEKNNAQAVACQHVIKQDTNFPLGKADVNTTWEIMNMTPDDFEFKVTYTGGQQDRVTIVTFTHTTGTMGMIVTSSQNKKYIMTMSGNKVGRASSGGGGGTIAGPIGIVLILLAIAGLVTYFIVGGVYMYRVKGARGMEVIPNSAFWKDLPVLIKDGFLFTISPCYKRSEKYENL